MDLIIGYWDPLASPEPLKSLDQGGGGGGDERLYQQPCCNWVALNSFGFGVWGLRFRVWGLGFRIEGLGFKVEGLRFRVGAAGFGSFAKLEVVQDTLGMCGALRGAWCHQKGFRRECYRNFCVVRTHGEKGPWSFMAKTWAIK